MIRKKLARKLMAFTLVFALTFATALPIVYSNMDADDANAPAAETTTNLPVDYTTVNDVADITLESEAPHPAPIVNSDASEETDPTSDPKASDDTADTEEEMEIALDKEAPAPEPELKKAIYILPGFFGSRLYSQRYNGLEIWLNVGLASEIGMSLLFNQSEFANDATGTGMTAYADRNRDKNGAFFIYQPMISSIKTSLALNGLWKTYEVEFFAYNFLADLNDNARELAADIDMKGYDQVVLIGHSNGGMLMATFIAQSEANKNKVEKAIGIVSPLWGSYTALEPIETGSLTLFDGSYISAFLSLGYDIFLRPISKSWMQNFAKNSPNINQQLPGEEYINRIPIIYRSDSGIQIINNSADYYDLLNSSPNTNPLLISESDRSHKYLRETVFEKDIISKFDGIDLTIIGCEYGFVTPVSTVYRQSGSNTVYDGAIYSKAGDGLIPAISMKGDGRINFINLRGIDHFLSHWDIRVMRIVNDIILDRPIAGTLAELDDTPASPQTSSSSPAIGMSDLIRVEIKSSDPLCSTLTNSGIKVNINDNRGNTVARTIGETQLGFAGNNFVFSSWSTSDHATNIICYIPKNGYSMEVLTGNINRNASNLAVVTSSLDPSGAILSRHEYKLTGANLLSGSVFTLNGSKSMQPVARAGAKLTELSSASYQQNWRFSTDNLRMFLGEVTTLGFIGPDASYVRANDYIWATSNQQVATVSTTGAITATGPGAAVITATARDGSYKMEFVEVTVANW